MAGQFLDNADPQRVKIRADIEVLSLRDSLLRNMKALSHFLLSAVSTNLSRKFCQIGASEQTLSHRVALDLSSDLLYLFGNQSFDRPDMIPHPIPYQGSKRKVASQIVALMPEAPEKLIEPFAGSAAITLAALAEGKVSHVLLNDLNKPLVELWQSIIDGPDILANRYEQLWHEQLGQEKEYYNRIRSRFNQSPRPAYLLYLLARCVKASVRYNAQGEFNQSPDNRRRGTRPSTMRRQIAAASMLLRGRAALSAMDYRHILDLATESDMVYMDPPYQGTSGKRDARYIGGIELESFVEVLKDLNERYIPFIVSYDGRTGTQQHGQSLPAWLGLTRLELCMGRSSQATLLGRQAVSYESLYLSPFIQHHASHLPEEPSDGQQLSMFEGEAWQKSDTQSMSSSASPR